MKRIALYVLILALVWVIPVERTDVAKLSPIEVIAVYQTPDGVELQADTGDIGAGADAMSALENMRQTSPAIIYLDTAEYLLIGQGAEQATEELRKELKASLKLCSVNGNVDLLKAAKYLDVHGQLPTLRSWNQENSLPILTVKNGKMTIK